MIGRLVTPLILAKGTTPTCSPSTKSATSSAACTTCVNVAVDSVERAGATLGQLIRLTRARFADLLVVQLTTEYSSSREAEGQAR